MGKEKGKRTGGGNWGQKKTFALCKIRSSGTI